MKFRPPVTQFPNFLLQHFLSFREAQKKLLQAKLNVWQIELKALTSSIHHTLNFTASSYYSRFEFVTWKADFFTAFWYTRNEDWSMFWLRRLIRRALKVFNKETYLCFSSFWHARAAAPACLSWATWSIFILGIIFNSLSSRFAIRQPQRNEWNGKLWNLFCKSFRMKSAQLVVLKSKARSDAGEKLNQQLKV